MRRWMLLAVAVLAGCGGGDDNGEDTGAAGGGETVTISLVDFRLEPSTVRVASAGKYTFRATNDGGTQHALEVEGEGVEGETDTLDPGDSGEVTVELAAGEYELYCPIDGHRDQGMEGDLIVGGGGATTGEGETETDDD